MTWTRLIVGERTIARASPQTQHMREYRFGNDVNFLFGFQLGLYGDKSRSMDLHRGVY